MNFGVGAQVMCIDAKRLPFCGETGLKAGNSYTVLAVVACPHGTLVAVDDCFGMGECMCTCGAVHAGNYFPWRFIKLDRPPVSLRIEAEVTA